LRQAKEKGENQRIKVQRVGMTEEIAKYLGRKNARERKMMVATKRENISF
jgi:hypothetical protein